jgi:hypothetical protein
MLICIIWNPKLKLDIWIDVSLELLVLFATVVAIWMPAWAANPDGTWTNIAGNDAVNALIISQLSIIESYSPWKLQLDFSGEREFTISNKRAHTLQLQTHRAHSLLDFP